RDRRQDHLRRARGAEEDVHGGAVVKRHGWQSSARQYMMRVAWDDRFGEQPSDREEPRPSVTELIKQAEREAQDRANRSRRNMNTRCLKCGAGYRGHAGGEVCGYKGCDGRLGWPEEYSGYAPERTTVPDPVWRK